MHRRASAVGLALVCFFSSLSLAQNSNSNQRDLLSVRPVNRITATIDDARRVTVAGSRHAGAKPQYAAGAVAHDQLMEKMVLVLRPDATQQAAMDELIRAQQDPESAYFHRWLTPEQFGTRFGVSQRDLEQVTMWLRKHGLEIDEIPAGRRAIVFTGTVAQVEEAFHTSIQKYSVRGESHYANATNAEIPMALADVVRGVVALHDFRSAPQIVAAKPNYTAANGMHFLGPQDWVTIYDVNPIYSRGLDGSGQSIAVVGRVDVATSDVRAFRSNFGLPENDPQIIINGADPGFPNCADEAESALDVEWAGAIAKNATVKFVTSKPGTTDGINLSAQYAVAHNVAPIITLSYGLCEADYGSAGSVFWNSLWAQAAAQGISVFVSSGDSGAAGCDSPDVATATHGRGVNAICSTPYNTCVGGTQFDDEYNSVQYWSPTNGAGMSSALGYIPEVTWNESGWSGMLISTGGGASKLYGKPVWQSVPGVPADGMRDVPDVAMTSAIHDAYIIQIQNKPLYVAGTSAATPSLASVMALVLENTGSAQGNANPALYRLANLQLLGSGAPVFHDITSGNNSVPGATGFNAGVGYDPATGLGSVDAAHLVNHWSDWTAATFVLTASTSNLIVSKGGTGTLSLSETVHGDFDSPVALSVSGLPSGITVQFSSNTISPSAPVQVAARVGSNVAGGSYSITISGAGGGLTRSMGTTITVPVPSFTLAASTPSGTLIPGGSSTFTISTTVSGGFSSVVTLSASGLPKGVTAKFTPGTIAGNGSSMLTLKAATTASAGTFSITVKASGGGIVRSQILSLEVVVPSFTVALSGTSIKIGRGGSSPVTVTSAVVNGFNSALALSVSGMPRGVTASFMPSRIAAPGNGNAVVTLKVASTAVSGGYNLTVKANGGGTTKTQVLRLSVTAR